MTIFDTATENSNTFQPERITGYIDQGTIAELDPRFAEWSHRICGAVALYGASTRLGSDMVGFHDYFSLMLENGCYHEGTGWLQPMQARFAREEYGLCAISMTPERNADNGVDENITNMMDSGRLPKELDAPEVEMYREVFCDFRNIKDAVEWVRTNPQWMMIASVEPGYVTANDKHQLLLQSDSESVYAVDSSGMRAGKGKIFRLDEEFYKFSTGNCILLKRRDDETYVEGTSTLPYVAYGDKNHRYAGGLLHIDMLRTPGILDGMLVIPEGAQAEDMELVVHVQGIRYQERELSTVRPAYDDDFYVELGNVLLEKNAAFSRLGVHGTGFADGDLSAESIDTRARALNDYLDILTSLGFKSENITLSAQSQGCLVVTRAIAERGIGVKKIALVSPVMFSEQAERVPFGPEYSKELNVRGNYHHSRVGERISKILEQGTDVQITWMEHDEPNPIPEEVRRLWDDIALQHGLQTSELAGLYHNFTLRPPLTRLDIADGLSKPGNYLPAVREYAQTLV